MGSRGKLQRLFTSHTVDFRSKVAKRDKEFEASLGYISSSKTAVVHPVQETKGWNCTQIFKANVKEI